MRSPFQSRDLPALLVGAALAAVAGLLMGTTLHPNLGGEAPMAPQTRLAGGGFRLGDGGADPGIGRYSGPIPEYVTGTDARLPPAEFAAATREAPMARPEREEPVQDAHAPAPWRDMPQAPVAYPSDSGGVVYETDLPPPPPPPGDDDLG